MICLWCD